VLAAAAYALPSVADVEAQVQQGNYAQAQSMMRDVVAAKPGSAKAHYIYAEILAHNDKFAEAAREAALAKGLDPSLKFASPEKFNSFEELLEREQRRAGHAARSGPSLENLSPKTSTAPHALQPQRAQERSQGVPTWAWLAGLVVLAVLAWRMIDRSRGAPAAAPAQPSYASTAGMSPTPSYGPSGAVPSLGGSGLMGVGLAAAGGVAAGMLAEKLLEGGHEPRRDDSFFDRGSGANPAPTADPDATALEDRSIDFGNGNDWAATIRRTPATKQMTAVGESLLVSFASTARPRRPRMLSRAEPRAWNEGIA